jgi:Uroporphyrinogen-III decarboxylase
MIDAAKNMASRQRALDALNHKQPDRIPIDFGGTAVSGMHISCVAALRDYYGLEKRPVKVCDPFQMLGEIEADLQDAIGVDVVAVPGGRNLFGFWQKNWKEWRAPWGQEVLVPGDFATTEDDGFIYIHPQGDASAPPSGKLPKCGYFADAIIRQQEIDEDRLNPDDNLEEFGLYTREDIDYYAAAIPAAAKTGKAVMASLGGTALGDIALVPAPFLKHPKGIRDVAEWYMSTAMRQDYVREVFDRQTKTALKNLETINNLVGGMIDAAYVCGTDFGTQISTFCSKETFMKLYYPYYKRVNDWIHKNTGWKTFKHSCGAIEPFLPLLIDAGFDIINPVQCSAAGMKPELLKEKYGGNLTFWGGGVDTQQTLPFGTPAEVRAQALERCEIFSKNGGFVFSSVHNVQAKTPVENIAAMIDAVKEFNGNGR